MQIIQDTIGLEKKESSTKKVVIQGVVGAFHQIAAASYFAGKDIEVLPAMSFDKVVQAVEQGHAEVGLMAIENSVAGSLIYNYDLLRQSKLKITGEIFLRIKQNLMVLPGTKIEDLEEVHSHHMAIAQCRDFFRNHPDIQLVESADTALSAKAVREGNLTKVGAIASTLAAELYGLEIISGSIETDKQNHTRFWVLERSEMPDELEEIEKVSLCFATDHQVGSLHKVLSVLAAYGINLTSIQSTPILGKPWEYRIFIDFMAAGQISVEQAIDGITPLTHDLNVLGKYRKGEHIEY